MKRRNFLAGVAATMTIPFVETTTTAQSGAMLRPKALKPGDTVGLISPATYVPDPDALLTAIRTLEFFNLKVKVGKNTGKRLGTFQSYVTERLDDFHAMFGDPEVKGVFAIRGGYGSMHLLDRIDYDLVRKNPKVFLGYSDITAMHIAIGRHANLTTFHGPITLSPFTEYSRKHFRRALFETSPLGPLTNPTESNPLRPEHKLRAVRPGKATGRLVGGNLTLITATLGTPYEIDTKGKILYLEDVGEEPYSLDRMLTQMHLAKKFDGVAGVIFGECADCKPRDFQPSFAFGYTLGEVVNNQFGALNVPVLYGLTIGHTDDQLTLPNGVTATLDADKGILDISEPGVS